MKGFKASWLGEIQWLMLSNWWHRDSYYNPLSQNSEHGLPTERRDGEVDWSEVTRQDQIIDQDRQTVGDGGRGGWNGGIQKWCLRTGDRRRGDTVTRVLGEGVLHDSNPVLLSGFRDERKTDSSKEEESGMNDLSNTSGRALGQLRMWRCHRAGYTVRSDCRWPEGRDLWCRSSSMAFHVSLDVQDARGGTF